MPSMRPKTGGTALLPDPPPPHPTPRSTSPLHQETLTTSPSSSRHTISTLATVSGRARPSPTTTSAPSHPTLTARTPQPSPPVNSRVSTFGRAQRRRRRPRGGGVVGAHLIKSLSQKDDQKARGYGSWRREVGEKSHLRWWWGEGRGGGVIGQCTIGK